MVEGCLRKRQNSENEVPKFMRWYGEKVGVNLTEEAKSNRKPVVRKTRVVSLESMIDAEERLGPVGFTISV